MKHPIFKLCAALIVIYALLVISISTCEAQINSTFKGAESLNADSVTIRNYLKADSMANRETGWLFFNVQATPGKWRLGSWSTGQAIRWQDIGSSSSSGAVVTASNGLTKTLNNITLGGNLTGNTLIGGAGFSLSATNLSTATLSSSTLTTLNATGTGDVVLSTANESFTLNDGAGLGAILSDRLQIQNALSTTFWRADANNGTLLYTNPGGLGTATISSNAGTGPLAIIADGVVNTIPNSFQVRNVAGTNVFNYNTGTAFLTMAAAGGGGLSIGVTGGRQKYTSGNALDISSTGETTIIPSVNSQLTLTTTGTGAIVATTANTIALGAGGNIAFTMDAATGLVINANGGGRDILLSGNPGAASYIIISNIPTSCAGAPTGALANIAGVLNICP